MATSLAGCRCYIWPAAIDGWGDGMGNLDSVRIGDLVFDVMESHEAAERTIHLRLSGGGLVVTPNLDHLGRVSAAPALLDLYSRAKF
jgi:hypothetical protein